jgi:hypothetical protein
MPNDLVYREGAVMRRYEDDLVAYLTEMRGPGKSPMVTINGVEIRFALPFVVGPHGRIGTHRADVRTALKPGIKR